MTTAFIFDSFPKSILIHSSFESRFDAHLVEVSPSTAKLPTSDESTLEIELVVVG